MVAGRYGKAARRDAEPQPGEVSCKPKTAPEQGTYNAVLNLVADANMSLGNGEVILQPVTLVVIDNLWRRPSDKGWFGEFLVGPGYEPGWIQTQQAAIFALSPDGAISEVLMINRVYLNDIQGIFSNVQNTAFVPTDDGQWVLAPLP